MGPQGGVINLCPESQGRLWIGCDLVLQGEENCARREERKVRAQRQVLGRGEEAEELVTFLENLS